MAWWLKPRNLDPEVRVGAPLWSEVVVSLSKRHFSEKKKMVIPRKMWLRPNLTEKLFTGTLSLNEMKQKPQMFCMSSLLVI